MYGWPKISGVAKRSWKFWSIWRILWLPSPPLLDGWPVNMQNRERKLFPLQQERLLLLKNGLSGYGDVKGEHMGRIEKHRGGDHKKTERNTSPICQDLQTSALTIEDNTTKITPISSQKQQLWSCAVSCNSTPSKKALRGPRVTVTTPE